MRKNASEPCIPTRGSTVPAGKDWLHEKKHDGYRLTVQRDGRRVRLFTRNGHDWSGRFPRIKEAALRNRNISLVADDEAPLYHAPTRRNAGSCNKDRSGPRFSASVWATSCFARCVAKGQENPNMVYAWDL